MKEEIWQILANFLKTANSFAKNEFLVKCIQQELEKRTSEISALFPRWISVDVPPIPMRLYWVYYKMQGNVGYNAGRYEGLIGQWMVGGSPVEAVYYMEIQDLPELPKE